MRFVGRDFLNMPAPPGYKAGVGRGAVGFSTTAERGGGAATDAFPGRPPHGSTDASGKPAVRASRENSEAEAIYAAIEARLAPRRSKRPERPDRPDGGAPPLKSSLQEVSIDEWASLPDAADLTHRNKRLREDERALKRSYAVPDALLLAQQDEEQRLADLRRRRLMLENRIRAEPRRPEGYLGLARLEQEAARHKRARVVIEKGSLMCPSSPEVWLESIQLHPNSAEARAIAAKACRACPDSEPLWLRAVALQPTSAMKAQVTHEALLHCSQSAELWLLAARFEDDKAAKHEVLRTAVEFLPHEEKLWLALVEATDASDQQTVLLREAAASCPASLSLWLLAAQRSTDADVECIVKETVDKGHIPRSELVRCLLSLGPEDKRLITSLARALNLDAVDLIGKPVGASTRDLLYAALPRSESLYLEWAKTDAKILDRAVQEFPQSTRLWREYIAAGGDAEAVLQSGRELGDEALLRVAVESLLLRGRRDAALRLLEARHSSSPGLLAWLVELYELSNAHDDALRVLDKGLAQWPRSAELYLAKARLEPQESISHLRKGLKQAPLCDELRPALWHELALRTSSGISQRAILSQAIGEYPHNGALWLQRVLLEKREGQPVTQVLEDALRHCASYGLLWWEALRAAPPVRRKAKLAEAVKSSKGDIYVLLAGGLLFISAGQRDKAQDWFLKAHAREPANGDVVLWMCKYSMADKALVDTAVNGTARKGLTWSQIYRQSIMRARPLADALHDTAAALTNPFD